MGYSGSIGMRYCLTLGEGMTRPRGDMDHRQDSLHYSLAKAGVHMSFVDQAEEMTEAHWAHLRRMMDESIIEGEAKVLPDPALPEPDALTDV